MTSSGPIFGDEFLTATVYITECPCDCGCGELSEDGEPCICCRTGVHNADQE